MGKYSDTSVYSLITALLADDLILFHADLDDAEHLIKFSDLVASIAASLSQSFTTDIVTGNVTLDAAYEMVVANSGSALAITLPAAASFPGKPYYISNKGAGACTVGASGIDHIDAGTNLVLAQWEYAILISDGVDTWHILSN